MMQPKKQVPLPLPWYWSNIELSDQLHSELGPNHQLWNKNFVTVARREDNDDVLFKLLNEDNRYTVVHLTWSAYSDSSGIYPLTTIYASWDEFYHKKLLPDSMIHKLDNLDEH